MPARHFARSASPKRVLIVDDNEDAASLLAIGLEAFGHEVRSAHDGPAALALLDGWTPQVAVLDLGLPVMDGYELARRLMERTGSSGPRLIAVTGYGQERDRILTAAAGFSAHLVKPVELEEVLRIVDQ